MQNQRYKKSFIDAGSRMHVLDWVEGRGRDFASSLNEMLDITGVQVKQNNFRMPKGRDCPEEAFLTIPCEPLLPFSISAKLRKWWIAVDRNNPNEPNWDLAVQAHFPDGRMGLVLSETKAYAGELAKERQGKRLTKKSNLDNHHNIGAAIREAREALGGEDSGVKISRDTHYQFSNRVTFAWKLAKEGVPCVLIYLGFTGDKSIAKDYLRDSQHWTEIVQQHIQVVFPDSWIDKEFTVGRTPFWFLVRSLTCARESPIKGQRIKTERL